MSFFFKKGDTMIDIISLLSSDGYIMCNKTLIKMYGADCAILVGELCAEYNYYKSQNKLSEDDSLYSTQENIEDNTGLNAYSQRKALKILAEANIIQVTKKGMPAKNYFYINQSQLLNIFTTSASNFKAQDLQNLNLNNNKEIRIKENNIISKDIISDEPKKSDYESHMYSKEDFLGSNKKTRKPKNKNLYSKCVDEISIFTQDANLYHLLCRYLTLRLQIKDKPIVGVNQWKGILNKLDDIIARNPGMSYESVVKQSIERGYASFYPITSSTFKKNTFSEGDGLSCEQATDTAEERKERLEKQGRRSEF